MADQVGLQVQSDGLRTLARATQFLRLLAEAPDRPQPLSTLAPRSGLHKATAHRVLAGLVAEGLVEQIEGGYVLGHQTWLLGQAAAQRYDLADLTRPVLEAVAKETGDVALLSILVGRSVRCMGRAEGDNPILPMTLKPGIVRPLGCGAHALALLATLSDAEVDRALVEDDRSAFPAFTEAYLRGKVEETREQGFALSDEDIVRGMTAVGVVIRDGWQRPLASLSCAAVSGRLDAARRPAVVDLLRRSAAEIEARLQGRSPS